MFHVGFRSILFLWCGLHFQKCDSTGILHADDVVDIYSSGRRYVGAHVFFNSKKILQLLGTPHQSIPLENETHGVGFGPLDYLYRYVV